MSRDDALACLTDREVAAIVARHPASAALLETATRHAAECEPCRELLAAMGRVLAAEASRDPTEPASSADSAPTHGAAMKPGAMLGRYRIGRELGRGGMGVVYEGHDPDLARRVAIKVLHGGATVAKLARMSREAQAVAALSHPNVVQIFDVSVAADPAFIVMEFVAGETLREWVHAERPGWRSIVQAYLQAARGLAAAHAAGLVHRDFKPGNAIIDATGRVTVLDFGLARADGESSLSSGGELPLPFAATTLTATGVAVGTPSYMAPEQHRGERADARADVYGLAVALYEALYDRLPFDAKTVELLVIQKERGPDREVAGSEIPAAVHATLVTALAYDPDDRWPTMDAFANALAIAARRRRPVTWMLAGISAVALAGAAFFDTTPALVEHGTASAQVDIASATEAIDAIERARDHDLHTGLGIAMAATTLAAASGSTRVRAHAEIELGRRLIEARQWPLALGWLRDGIANATAAGDDRAAASATIRSIDVLNELGRSDEARDAGRQARALVDRLQGDNTLLPGLLSAEARALPAGHPQKIALYEESLALRRADPKLADPIAMAATLNNLGANVGGEDPQRAHAFFSEALQIRERVQGPDHPDALVNALNLVGLDYEVGNYGDCMERGPRVYAALPEAELSPRALAAEIVAGCSIEVRAFVEGLEWIDRALAIQATLDPEGMSYAAMLETKAILVSHRGDWTETEALLQRALVIREGLSRGPSLRVAHSRYRLAVAARQLGELDRAEAYARRSLTEAASFPDAQGILHARTMLARILIDAGRHAEAVDVLAEYLDLPADGTVDPMYVANAKGVYASAAWEVGDRSRAIELAREAADALVRRHDFIAEHDEITIWLGSHS